MTAKELPPVEFLRECFSYDPDTGAFLWQPRPEHHFADTRAWRIWNTKHAGAAPFNSIDAGRLSTAVVYAGKSVRMRAHRVAYKLVTGEEPPEILDHINGDPGDNRFSNLRPAEHAENCRNNPGHGGRLLPKGVHFCSSTGKFRAHATIRRRAFFIGAFSTPSAAHTAYCEFVNAEHGEFFNPGPQKLTVFD